MRKLAYWALAGGITSAALACSSSEDDDGGSPTGTGASGSGGTGAAGGVGPASGGGGSSTGDCASCASESCGTALDACLADGGCEAWWGCVQGCGDAVCRAGCDLQHIGAEALYLDVAGCLCDSCGADCADLAPCDAAPCVDEGLPLMMTPPATLAETGLYQTGGMQLAEYVQHFVPQFQLWSDGASKERWAYIPKCSQIDTGDMDHWKIPVGARFWKEFTRDGVRIETRLIHRYGPGDLDWFFAAYHWDDAQAAASYVPAGVQNASGTQHDIPSDAQCRNCHMKLPEKILGFSALQLSFDPAAGDASMASLSAAGWLTVPAAEGFAVPGDATAQEALGYLHANCGNCHNEAGVPAVDMKLRLLVDDVAVEDTDVWQTSVGKTTTLFQCGGCERIEPGFPAQSAIIQRMSVRGTSDQMPPLGTELVHAEGVEVVSAWISTLTACSAAGEPCNGTIGCCGGSCVDQVCVDQCTSAGGACTGNTDCCTGVCDANGTCSCSGDFQPCATTSDCCNNVTCDTDNGLCL